MSNYCKQCSEELFGRDYLDLSNFLSPGISGDHEDICEGCGPTVVDQFGKCIGNCLKHHSRNGKEPQAEWEE